MDSAGDCRPTPAENELRPIRRDPTPPEVMAYTMSTNFGETFNAVILSIAGNPVDELTKLFPASTVLYTIPLVDPQ